MPTNYLALDVGEVRIGTALANDIARIAAAGQVLTNDSQILDTIERFVVEQDISVIVVGLPRGLDGQTTEQTAYVQAFVAKLRQQVKTKVVLQDEALTSYQAESELQARGKRYQKADIDNLSAVYILEDYLAEGVH